jgi:protein Mpv17
LISLFRTHLLVFLAASGFLETGSTEHVKHLFQRQFVPIMKANYAIWPAVNLVNFWFVPIDLRVLYLSSFGLVWSTYLCYEANKKVD